MFSRIFLVLGLSLLVAADQVRINCGGPQLPDIGWRADTGKYRSKPSAGFISSTPVNATGTWRPVYESHAYAPSGDLGYSIPVHNGVYTLFLLFSEVFTKAEGTRLFSVAVNNVIIYPVLDVFSSSGGLNQPLFKSVPKVNVTDGYLNITLGRVAGKENPMISGIVIDGVNATAKIGNEGLSTAALPSPSPSSSPVVVNAVDPVPGCDVATEVTGRSKGKFSMNVGGGAVADLGFGGENVNYIEGPAGKTATTKGPVLLPDGTNAGAVYLSERYTFGKALTYKIPVLAGKYNVSLMHAETFLNASEARVFNITINGKVARSNVDIFALAGKNRAVVFEYPNVPSVKGVITISFTKGIENPFVNGIIITGPGADAIAIGGLEDGSCKRALVPIPAPTLVPEPPTPTPSSGPAVGCRVAESVTGSLANNTGFLMNIGGPAVKSISAGAENVNYIVEANKGRTFLSKVPVPVGGTWGPIFLSHKYTFAKTLTYKIPALATGNYKVALFFAEPFFNATGLRAFDVAINGKIVLDNLDVFARVGKDKPLFQQFNGITATDGFIAIQLTKVVENPLLNGIYIQGPEIGTTAIGGFEDGSC